MAKRKCVSNRSSLQLNENVMSFLPEFNLIKKVRHGAVEIRWTDILRKELITGTLILHLCAPFSMIWMLSCQSVCRAGACPRPGDDEPVQTRLQIRAALQICRDPGRVMAGHEMLGSHKLVDRLEKLIPVQCKVIHTHCSLGISPHYYQCILQSHTSVTCVFLSPSMFFNVFFFFCHGGESFLLLF